MLQPNDPDSYYKSRELVPGDMLGDLERAKIVITNFHAFKRRETMEVSKGGRALLQGRGADLRSTESEGQMLQRVIPELMGMKNVLALNDEAHHCYRERPGGDDEGDLKGEDRKEAEKNREAARLWISGLEAVGRKLGLNRVIDLSATPFFLRGSGYAEGTLFPWTMSDFSLMDAIECGIVKLPRVPVDDNISTDDMPKFRNLWEHIRKDMPKKGRGKASKGLADPLPGRLWRIVRGIANDGRQGRLRAPRPPLQGPGPAGPRHGGVRPARPRHHAGGAQPGEGLLHAEGQCVPDRWLPDRDKEIGRETTPDSWRTIVESLGNSDQQRIVADDREQTNVLVLAGPGSGKTRVLVHRIAYLVRVRRENARGILALAYNRHAAVDIRRRLHALIGDDARGVTVLTCHGLAMRLSGASFTGRAETPDDKRSWSARGSTPQHESGASRVRGRSLPLSG